MKTDADRVRWAVRFSEMNVFQLSEPALRKLRRDLEAFLGEDLRGVSFATHVAVTRPPYVWDYSVSDLHSLRDDLYSLLRGAAIGDGTAGGVDLEKLVTDVVHDRRGNRIFRIGGSVRDGFLLSIAVLLATEAGKRVMACPECGRIFVRIRRQLYCSPRCTDRATWRNYPEDKKRRAREPYYKAHGWTQGARKKGAKK